VICHAPSFSRQTIVSGHAVAGHEMTLAQGGSPPSRLETPMNASSHIAVILDRTGSMADIRDDVIGGFNTFLLDQQAQPTPATLTLVQFDSEDPYEIVQPVAPIHQARPLTRATYVPRASTPLYDAIGRGIVDLEASAGTRSTLTRRTTRGDLSRRRER
jgi:hypothetical protein